MDMLCYLRIFTGQSQSGGIVVWKSFFLFFFQSIHFDFTTDNLILEQSLSASCEEVEEGYEEESYKEEQHCEEGEEKESKEGQEEEEEKKEEQMRRRTKSLCYKEVDFE